MKALAILVAALALACTDESRATPTAAVTDPPPPQSTPTPSSLRQLTDGIIVEFWEPTQPGWILVLDTTLDNDTAAVERAHLLLVDPGAGEVRGRILTGYHPHAALSPDGASVYLAIGHARPRGAEGVLAAIDTATGGLRWSTSTAPLQTGVPSRVRQLEVSADGSLVYSQRTTVIAADDGRLMTLGPTRVSCEVAIFTRPAAGSGMFARCAQDAAYAFDVHNGDLVVSNLDFGVAQAMQTVVSRPSSVTDRLVLPDRRGEDRLYSLTSDGRIAVHELTEQGLGALEVVDLHFPDETIIPFTQAVLSPGGDRLYLPVQEDHFACGGCYGRGSGDVIRVFDTRDWSLVREIVPSTLVSAMALSPEGDHLYLVDIDAGPLVAIDTTTFEEVASIEIGARTPATLLVMP